MSGARQTVRMLVRAREDFQAMRKRMDNRIGRKADGTAQNIEEREFREDHALMFSSIADAARGQEKAIEKMLRTVLREFPVYTGFLSGVKGVGDIAAGWIIGEYDIHKATNVSKLWQFTGLNPGMVPGKKRCAVAEYKPEKMGRVVSTFYDDKGKPEEYIYLSGQMVPGDRLIPGHVAPFNKRLRTAMVGVLADGFIKAQATYALEYYYPYKARLEQEASEIEGVSKDAGKAWSDVSKGHRDRAAKRYMIKMFLKDLYVAWRTLEGLPVRRSYQEEYLGHEHGEDETE